MKDKALAVFLSMVLALGMTACADRTSAEEKPREIVAEENTEEYKDYEELEVPEELPEEEPEVEEEDDEKPEMTVPRLSDDFDGLEELDNTVLGWGPGGPVDGNNRSQGAVSYQQKYGDLDADFIAENTNKIYLTFDEGYENGYTEKILDVLKEKDCPAVFFVTMPYAKGNPELIQRMIDEGHVVANHSVNHLIMPELSAEEQYNEIVELHNYIKEEFDYDMNLFRYPTGAFSEQSLAIVSEIGYRSVFWSFAYKDWLVDEQPDCDEALSNLKEKAHPGAIYLLHAVSSTNTEILGDFIDWCRDEGYEFSDYIV